MTSLYVHIPFCRKKCNYCDFVSYAGKEDLIDGYVEKLIEEITALTPRPPLPFIPSEVEEEGEGELTLFFGGGTPTLLSPHHFSKILNNVAAVFRPPLNGNLKVASTEVSIEANPGTADLTKLAALRHLGINRLSIGVQSFNDQHLKTLGRIHNSQQAIQFYNDAREAGFKNINLDLIFSLPNQTLDEWKKDLQTAIDLGPEHLSCYSLQIEEGTKFWEQYNPHPCLPAGKALTPSPRGRGGTQENEFTSKLPSEDDELAMYEYTIETLTKAGYKHYEISNFAKPGFECQHNINYWEMGNWLGLGAGAHSHVNGQRWANTDSIEEYIKSNFDHRASNNVTSIEDQQRISLFMGLRLIDGISIDKFKGFEKQVAELIEQGLLVQDQNNYKLTRKGLYLGNMVFERFV